MRSRYATVGRLVLRRTRKPGVEKHAEFVGTVYLVCIRFPSDACASRPIRPVLMSWLVNDFRGVIRVHEYITHSGIS